MTNIIIDNLNEYEIAQDCVKALVRTEYYNMGGKLVRVVPHDIDGYQGKYKKVEHVTAQNLLRSIGRNIDFVRNVRSVPQKTKMPERVARIIVLERDLIIQFLPLKDVLLGPYIGSDGKIFAVPGYNEAGYFVGWPKAYSDVSALSDKKYSDYQNITTLMNEIENYLFSVLRPEAELDKSAILAALMTASMYKLIPLRPAIAISAIESGAGKSFLANIIHVLAKATPAKPIRFGSNEAALERSVSLHRSKGEDIIFFDNITKPIQGEHVEATIVSIMSNVRNNRGDLVEATAPWYIFTGNKAVIAGDMRRRALLIRVAPPDGSNLIDGTKFLSNLQVCRDDLVAGFCRIVAYWLSRPEQAEMHPVATFDQWSHWIRRPLVLMGYPDPIGAMPRYTKYVNPIVNSKSDKVDNIDPAMDKWTALLMIEDIVKKQAFFAYELCDALIAQRRVSPELRRVMGRSDGSIDAVSVGKGLSRLQRLPDRPYLTKKFAGKNRVLWIIE